MASFAIFTAKDIPSLVTELNAWGASMENFTTEIRSAVVSTAVETETLRNGIALLEMRTEQIGSVGNQAVHEIEKIMAAFRAEIILNKQERLADGEALKAELRVLVSSVQAKFDAIDSAASAATASRLQVEESIRALKATAAAAASAARDVADPWFRGGQTAPRDASRAVEPSQFAMDEDDTGSSSQARTRPPGISAAPAQRWTDSEWTARMAGGPARSDWRREKTFQVDMRNWKTANLDLFANPAGFSAWQYRAIGMLSGNRTDVRRLLEWAELKKAPIDTAMAQQGAEQVGLTDDVGTVSYILFEAMKQMLADSMLNRARTCGDNGLELWRALAAEYKGSSDQVLAAKAQSYQYPPRCATLAKLWEELPRWEQTGHEMATSSLNIHPVMKAQALNHLVPESLLQIIIGRPELSEYEPKLRWVKAQIEHYRGTVHAQHTSNPKALNSIDSDQKDLLIWQLQAAVQQYQDACDLQNLERSSQALFAMKGQSGKKGRPSGKGGGEGGKGGKGAPFTGDCFNCGEGGHRSADCPQPETEQTKAARFKRKGSKGNGKGNKGKGKSLEYAAIEPGAEAPEPEREDSEWWMGTSYDKSAALLTRDIPPPPEQVYRRPARRPIETSNSFRALSEAGGAEDETEWPTPFSASSPAPHCHGTAGCCRAKAGPAEQVARAPAGPRLQNQPGRRRKYISLCLKDEVLLQAVAKDLTYPGFKLVEGVLDSGAEESVSPPRYFPGPVTPSAMSKAQGSYRVADGHRVPNIGQQKVHFRTDEDHPAGLLFQTAEIERPLISASQLAAAGNQVVFSKRGGEIIHEKTGRRTKLHKRGGIYVLRMWIPVKPTVGFAGPGRK